MTLSGRAERLSVYLDQTAHHGRVSTFVSIVERARALHMAGLTVLQGVEGFGGSARIHRRHALAARDDVPVVIIVVDTAERIDALLAETEPLLSHGMVVRQPVDVVLHRGGGSRRRGTDP